MKRLIPLSLAVAMLTAASIPAMADRSNDRYGYGSYDRHRGAAALKHYKHHQKHYYKHRKKHYYNRHYGHRGHPRHDRYYIVEKRYHDHDHDYWKFLGGVYILNEILHHDRH